VKDQPKLIPGNGRWREARSDGVILAAGLIRCLNSADSLEESIADLSGRLDAQRQAPSYIKAEPIRSRSK